jgi:hypothetical protein
VALGLLEIGGKPAFVSGVDAIKVDSAGKLALSVIVGRATLETLFGVEIVNVSGDRELDGAGGRADERVESGNDEDAKLSELVLALAVNRGEGYSGKFEPSKLEAPGGKDELNPEYCNGGCIEGGIDSPGGGRSKDCWCN